MKSLYISLFICLLIVVGTESRRKFKADSTRGSRMGCADGERVHRCYLNPCMLVSCVDPPNLECRPNYCGGCNAHFYERGSNERISCAEMGRPVWSVYGQRTRQGRRRPRL